MVSSEANAQNQLLIHTCFVVYKKSIKEGYGGSCNVTSC